VKLDVMPGFEEQEREFIERECGKCARKKKNKAEPLAVYLLDKLGMQDAGCPLGRHDLKNHEWQLLGILKNERQLVWNEEQKQKRTGQNRG